MFAVVLLVACATGATALSGCATIVSGTRQDVRIETRPAGATIEIQGHVFEAPASVTLSRSVFSGVDGRAILSGYKEARFEITREFNLWALGNVVTLFLTLPVDVLSGAMFKFPEEHTVLLRRVEQEE